MKKKEREKLRKKQEKEVKEKAYRGRKMKVGEELEKKTE